MPSKNKINRVLCPKCGNPSGVHSGRPLIGNIYKRERSCKTCGHCFSTYEISEEDAVKLYGDKLTARKNNSKSICWDCKRATGFCSWSRDFEPVRGWEAEPTVIKENGLAHSIDSYDVKRCPLFLKDRT